MPFHHRRQHAFFVALTMVVVLALLVFAAALAALSAGDELADQSPPPPPADSLLPSTRFLRHRGLVNSTASSHSSPSADLPNPGPLDAKNLGRGAGGPWLDGPYTYYCGIFQTGIPATIRAGSLSLRVVNITYMLPAGACLRVYCYDTSAVYVCSNSATENLAVSGYDIGWMADRLSLLCCDAHHAASAQLFHPTDRWNTVVGYGNCRHDPAEPPSAYGQGNGGVNGDCVPNESRPSNPGKGQQGGEWRGE